MVSTRALSFPVAYVGDTGGAGLPGGPAGGVRVALATALLGPAAGTRSKRSVPYYIGKPGPTAASAIIRALLPAGTHRLPSSKLTHGALAGAIWSIAQSAQIADIVGFCRRLQRHIMRSCRFIRHRPPTGPPSLAAAAAEPLGAGSDALCGAGRHCAGGWSWVGIGVGANLSAATAGRKATSTGRSSCQIVFIEHPGPEPASSPSGAVHRQYRWR